jgi:hypothetical protein
MIAVGAAGGAVEQRYRPVREVLEGLLAAAVDRTGSFMEPELDRAAGEVAYGHVIPQRSTRPWPGEMGGRMLRRSTAPAGAGASQTSVGEPGAARGLRLIHRLIRIAEQAECRGLEGIKHRDAQTETYRESGFDVAWSEDAGRDIGGIGSRRFRKEYSELIAAYACHHVARTRLRS